MSSGIRNYRFIDTGSAPEFFANGLHEVQLMGCVARFVFYALRPGRQGEPIAEPPFTFVAPTEAIGPGIALIIRRCPGLILPATAQAARALIN